MDLQALPEAWVHQLAASLPSNSRHQLRACCRALQRQVDAAAPGGVTWMLPPGASSAELSTALALAAPHIRSINAAAAPGAAAALAAVAEQQRTAGAVALPRLQHLSVTLQAGALALVRAVLEAGAPLEHLALLHCQGADAQACAAQLTPLLPGLRRHLRCLELDQPAHRFVLAQPATELDHHSQLLSWIGGLAGGRVDSLLLRAPRRGAGLRPRLRLRLQLGEGAWQAALAPLAPGLTRLELGQLAAAQPSQWSSDEGGGAPAAAGAVPGLEPAAAARLAGLRALRCHAFDGDAQHDWSFAWVAACTQLTALDLVTCASELDIEVLAQLPLLAQCSLSFAEDELISSSTLCPLSACRQLTSLRLGSLVVEPGHGAAAAAPAPAAVVGGAGGGGTAGSVLLPQLASLRTLTAGLLCHAPVGTLAPRLTRLVDLDYDLAELELPASFIIKEVQLGLEPLAGLPELRTLGANIFALVRHAACPESLSALRELHVSMVGGLDGTHLAAHGLPRLPQLTLLAMKLGVREHTNLDQSYSTKEDVLLWQNQASVRHLRLRGTARLGGFLTHDELLAWLPLAMPQLRRVELVKCSDLQLPQLHRLVTTLAGAPHAAGSPSVLVQGCSSVSARDCAVLEAQAGGAVAVDFAA